MDVYRKDDLETVCRNIREKLIAGVDKRLDADAPLGFLLSGGLDSSLVCAIAAKILGKKIRTFAIGMDTDAIDLKYAREAADFIGSDHTEVIITKEDVLKALPEVVAALGTYDITTIRASMGMYLVCKAIHEQTDIGSSSPGRSPTSSSAISTPISRPPPLPSRRRPKSGWMSSICTTCFGPIGASASSPSRPECPSATWTL